MQIELEKIKDIGSYCGDLSTPSHILEQILVMIHQTGATATILDHAPQDVAISDISILFTSLYSWYEFSYITDQRDAIRAWDQKFIKIGDSYFRLNLLHYNIPFNALNRYPTPAELKAVMQDMNDEAWIILTARFWQYLHLDSKDFSDIAYRIHSLRSLGNKHFIERETALLEAIDAFREIKPSLVIQLNSLASTPLILALRALYEKKLRGIDKLLYLDYVIRSIGYFHNKNSRSTPERTAAASAADKAQHDFQQAEKKPFLPQHASQEEIALFKKLYSMYWVYEEPPIQSNPETRRYLENVKRHG